MAAEESYFKKFIKGRWIILIISLFNFCILFLPNLLGYYGFWNDEFYYIACSKRLAWGYVDFPPLSIYLLRIIRWIFGDSILAIRLLPALANASSVFLVGIITKKLGGKIFAQFLACFAFSIIPLYLLLNSSYAHSALEPLLLTCCILVLIVIIQENKPRYWMVLGLMIGTGLINKHTFAIFGVAIFIGIIFTPLRQYFKSKYFWLGILIVIIVIMPNIIWQFQNDFVSVKYYKYISDDAPLNISLLMIIIPIIIVSLNPAVFPICLLGLVFLFFKTEGKPYRVFGWMFLISFVFFLLMNTERIDRMAPVYPILIASGSIMIELWIKKINKIWLKPFFVSILIIGGIFSFLISLPVLPPSVLQKYIQRIELANQEYSYTDMFLRMMVSKYCRIFADRLGWESMVEDVAIVYHRLPEQDKENAVILSSYFAEPGAIELFGPKYHLPMVISLQHNYRLWGYGKATGDLIIAIGGNKEELDSIFERVEVGGVIQACDFCWRYKNDVPIYICREMKISLSDFFQFANLRT